MSLDLYDVRMGLHALLVHEWAQKGLHSVHKSWLHHDGEMPFNHPDWFIVVAVLPTGQISNHYHRVYWELFHCVEVPKALFQFDGHDTGDVIQRMKDHLRDLTKKDDAHPAAVYQFRDITKPPTPTPDPLQKLRIVTESLVRIIFSNYPFVNGIYPLVHAGETMVFWRVSGGAVYSGQIVKKDDDYQGFVAYHVECVLKCPPFGEYGR